MAQKIVTKQQLTKISLVKKVLLKTMTAVGSVVNTRLFTGNSYTRRVCVVVAPDIFHLSCFQSKIFSEFKFPLRYSLKAN